MPWSNIIPKCCKIYVRVLIFIFFIPYSAAVFMGLSYLFKSNFNMDYTLALGLMGFFTALYVVLGGYKSIAMIDVLFGKIMIVGVCILLCFTIDKGNGLANITANLSAIDPDLTQLVGPPGIWPLFCLVF